MSGGYVMYDGTETNKVHRAPGSKNSYTFVKGKYIRVGDKDDFKWYSWKAGKNDPEYPIWYAKVRLGKDDISLEEQTGERDLIDENDPNWEADLNRRQVYLDYQEAKERFRQYYGSNLSTGLKKAKKIYGGD